VIHAMGDNHLLRTRTPVVRTLHGSALGEALHARRLVTKALFTSIYPLELIGIARATRTATDSAASMRHFPLVHAATIPNGVADEFFASSDAKSAAPSITAVYEDVGDLSFEYLGAVSWQDDWDAASESALPRAVKAEVSFKDGRKAVFTILLRASAGSGDAGGGGENGEHEKDGLEL